MTPAGMEMFREIIEDPIRITGIAHGYVESFGVDVTMVEDPALYASQVSMLVDPRYRNSRGDTRHISRQQSQAAHSIVGDESLDELYGVCKEIGIMQPEYPFDEFAKTTELIVVTGGVLSALKNRTETALKGPEVPVVVAGGSRKLNPDELEEISKLDVDIDFEPKIEADAARIVASMYGKDRGEVSSFQPSAFKPDNKDTIDEILYLNRTKNRRIGFITTNLYVPFTGFDIKASLAKYGPQSALKARVYAGPSSDEAIARRTPNTYQSELAKTLVSAARAFAEQKRRGIFR